jgi:hypothetical protein
MTEEELTGGRGTWQLWEFVAATASPRKLRLFGCACVRRVFDLIPDRRGRLAVEVAERFSDGVATAAELREAYTAAGIAAGQRRRDDDFAGTHALLAGMSVADATQRAGWSASTEAAKAVRATNYGAGHWDRDITASERPAQADVIRDIFGHLFRPVAFDPRWRTADAVGLARGIYEDRAFDRLPLLADALMDAGCADEQVLGHCPSDGPHVRGCWVVDLVLGKE